MHTGPMLLICANVCTGSVHAGAAPLRQQYDAAVGDLVARAVHCCYAGHWAARMGGVAALGSLVPRLPEAALPRLAPLIAKAVFSILRILPEEAREEQELSNVLQAVLRRCCVADAASPTHAQPALDAAPATAAVATSPRAAAGAVGAEQGEGLKLPPLQKQLMEIFVQHLLSSRSSTAVRTAAATALQVIQLLVRLSMLTSLASHENYQ